jgi:hypothetical protein
MTRLFNLAAGMGLPSARYARFGQAHTGDLQKRRYTTGAFLLFADGSVQFLAEGIDTNLFKDLAVRDQGLVKQLP